MTQMNDTMNTDDRRKDLGVFAVYAGVVPLIRPGFVCVIVFICVICG